MSKTIKTNPKGIDVKIQAMQGYLYDQLLNIWPVDGTSYNSFGRAYRNQTKEGYIPEVFDSNSAAFKRDYKEVLFNDRVKVTSFFGVGEQTKYDKGSATVDVYLIFMVNVNELKPTIQHRGDEEIRREAEMLCAVPRHGFTMTGIETGIDNVFKEYPGIRRDEGMKYRDMHPKHCFRINFQLMYNINDC